MRGVSKHEGPTNLVLILRDGRTPSLAVIAGLDPAIDPAS